MTSLISSIDDMNEKDPTPPIAYNHKAYLPMLRENLSVEELVAHISQLHKKNLEVKNLQGLSPGYVHIGNTLGCPEGKAIPCSGDVPPYITHEVVKKHEHMRTKVGSPIQGTVGDGGGEGAGFLAVVDKSKAQPSGHIKSLKQLGMSLNQAHSTSELERCDRAVPRLSAQQDQDLELR
ncbi:hypothetical protein Dda_7096 [Drechslerella dactyloides]|uniref:Uncharacterized protein n=1 Tax=Drechslerella dactyloides TaxID=74499 RepID=A0AAD6IXG2_DREDA|nr:hypothetical protein Dda_7096 [Drechslerella dactyloides]